MREYRIPGVALGIVANGVTTVRGFGVTSVEDPLPVTAHTVFPIVSISKTFAATAMMRLVEQGKVDLRAPVRSYLPDFRVQDEAVSREVTIWHLLTHSSGWEGQVSGPDRGEETLKNFVSTIGGLMQLAPPGAGRLGARQQGRDAVARMTAAPTDIAVVEIEVPDHDVVRKGRQIDAGFLRAAEYRRGLAAADLRGHLARNLRGLGCVAAEGAAHGIDDGALDLMNDVRGQMLVFE